MFSNLCNFKIDKDKEKKEKKKDDKEDKSNSKPIPIIKTEDKSGGNENKNGIEISPDAPPPTHIKKPINTTGPALPRRDRRQSSSLFIISANRELQKLPSLNGLYILLKLHL